MAALAELRSAGPVEGLSSIVQPLALLIQDTDPTVQEAAVKGLGSLRIQHLSLYTDRCHGAPVQ